MHIVTGGAGFIGSAFVWKLNSMGVTDIIVVDDLGTSDKWKNLVNRTYVDYVHKDMFLEMVMHEDMPFDVDSIIHMGACSSTTERNADYLMENNYRYTMTLAHFCLEHDVRFINASSAATYGDGSLGFDDDPDGIEALRPLNMYGYSKQLFDLWSLRTGAVDSLASLKFFNVFGPNEYHKGDMMSVICKAHRQIRDNGFMSLFRSGRPDYADGGQMRDFVYVKDCVDVMWWLLQNPQVNGIFNLGTGTARTWNDLARSVFSAMGVPEDIRYIDMPAALEGKYQYFTEAKMDRLREAGCPVAFRSLEDAVADYVGNHLSAPDSYL
ncbi:ADP-L-glycero-D-manno-heptose 6-epimerase [Desulfobaculum xiamenense]|uniref:ADP-L-glycero-D-manno-heptose-6-epimerase n=1 Tax=Desulfobaculum xiamenense TaxID=995050 RepID=A0A846QFB9_9BACT|nr:ADP-glyceromanno-heptose 6-epimerase [Desulfobaculum xiamenense]NJB67028.1 ADP-L-glycero-D-manno-heptose 6-epimerase [Desulfobaculum xiamenense]